jgi:hypothetical protein
MSEWIYFIHTPRDNFAATMTDEERRVWSIHFRRFERLLAEGVIILVGPTLGPVNTGIAIFEAPDEAAARILMNETLSSPAASRVGSSGRSGFHCFAGEGIDRRLPATTAIGRA